MGPSFLPAGGTSGNVGMDVWLLLLFATPDKTMRVHKEQSCQILEDNFVVHHRKNMRHVQPQKNHNFDDNPHR